ncbi:MAG: hypothetical protein V1799_17990 [bacterium]
MAVRSFYRIIFLIVVLGILTSERMVSQFVSVPFSPLKLTIQPSELQLNQYDVGGNPAALYYDVQNSYLFLQGRREAKSGSAHAPFEPGAPVLYEYYVEGAKGIGRDQMFKGQFGFRQEFRGDWQWMDTKSYGLGNPFILADSSTGRTVYRGIVANAQYSRLLAEGLTVGAEMTYGIDNGLKEVTPKPTSTNRDLSLRLGVMAELRSDLHAGLSFRYLDQQEEIRFEEDESGLLEETILFKFRGLDRYLRLTKKTELRNSQYHAYQGFLHGDVALNEASHLVAYGGGGVESFSIIDGGSSPRNEGYWQRENLQGHFQGDHPLGELRVAFRLDYSTSRDWSRHPEYNVLLSEGTERQVDATVGLEAQVIPHVLRAGIEYGFCSEKRTLDDYLSAIHISYSQTRHWIGFGSSYRMSERLQTTLHYHYAFQSIVPVMLEGKNLSFFFTSIRKREFDLSSAAGAGHHALYVVEYTTTTYGSAILQLSYGKLAISESTFFTNLARSSFSISLGLKISTM